MDGTIIRIWEGGIVCIWHEIGMEDIGRERERREGGHSTLVRTVEGKGQGSRIDRVEGRGRRMVVQVASRGN